MNININTIVQGLVVALIIAIVAGGINLKMAHSQTEGKVAALEAHDEERAGDHDKVVAMGKDIEHIKEKVEDLKTGQQDILEAITNGRPH